MNRPLFVAITERLRGRTLASFLDRWRRASWEREIERAAERARRLAEEYKHANRSNHPR